MAKIPKAITDMSTLSRIIFDPDTTPPSIPAGVVGTPISSTRIDLAWTASTDIGGSGLVGYQVYRNGAQIGLASQNAFSDTGLTANTNYSYQIAAYDGAGNVSGLSIAIGVTTQANAGPPTFAPVQPAAGFIGIAGLRTYTDPTQQAAMGRYNLFVMGASWEGWASSGRDLNTICVAVKAASTAPGGTVLLNYQNLNAVEEDANDPCPTYTAEVATRNWRVYLNGTSGPLATPNTPNISLVNCTDFVPVNPSLEHPYDFGAKYSYYKYLTKPKSDARFTGLNPGLASSNLDGVYQDNFVLNPQVNGDWNIDGITDGQGWPSAPTPWLAAGQLRYVTTMRSLAPTKYVFANAGDYGVTSAGVMVGQLDGMLCESYMGKSWSWETSQTWTTVRDYYYRALASAANPHMVVFGVTYPDTNTDGSALVRQPTSGGFPPQNTQWQWARYGAATAYLGEGMPGINRFSQGYSSDLAALDWYDFFGGITGLARSWLGAPIDALRPTTPKIAKGTIGIYGVEYTNGIVLVNPKGNGTQTVVSADIPGSWKFLTGTQDPTRDSGASFSSISLPERDGLILQRSTTGLFPSGHWVDSNLTFSIIAPHAGLATTNRYYKQYPGIPYRVPVIAIGGAYPYIYTLTTAPAGMTIGQTFNSTDYGIINWANPIAGTYTCTVQVQDQMLRSQTVTWTLTVTTTGFVFIDSMNGHASAANGGTGTGTLANPFKTFDDVYSGVAGHNGTNAARKADTTWANAFVYMRAGTYTTAQVNFEAGNAGQRAPMVSGNKPKVWIGYPGETATLDTTGSYISYYSETSVGLWFSNLTAAGMESTGGFKWLAFQSMSDHGIFEVKFSTPTATGTSGSNPDMLFSEANSPNLALRGFIKSCTFNNTLNHELFEMYSTSTWAIHDNVLAGVNDACGFYAKGDGTHPTTGGNDTISVRGNVGLAANNGRSLVELDNYAYSRNVEICYNVYKSSSSGINFGIDTGGSGTSNVASFRNTWMIAQQTIDAQPVTTLAVTNDVTKFTNAAANAHGYQLINGGTLTGATFTGEECVALNGTFVDTSGNLSGASRTSYLGLRGHEIA